MLDLNRTVSALYRLGRKKKREKGRDDDNHVVESSTRTYTSLFFKPPAPATASPFDRLRASATSPCCQATACGGCPWRTRRPPRRRRSRRRPPSRCTGSPRTSPPPPPASPPPRSPAGSGCTMCSGSRLRRHSKPRTQMSIEQNEKQRLIYRSIIFAYRRWPGRRRRGPRSRRRGRRRGPRRGTPCRRRRSTCRSASAAPLPAEKPQRSSVPRAGSDNLTSIARSSIRDSESSEFQSSDMANVPEQCSDSHVRLHSCGRTARRRGHDECRI